MEQIHGCDIEVVTAVRGGYGQHGILYKICLNGFKVCIKGLWNDKKTRHVIMGCLVKLVCGLISPLWLGCKIMTLVVL